MGNSLKLNNKICVVITWFGLYPEFFPLWYKTAIKNKDIDFLIIGPERFPTFDEIGKNIIYHKMSETEICERISKLGIDFKFDHYKLCDARPMYGKIFSDLLSSYDFWGFGDLDVLYGNITKQISKEMFKKFDVIATGSWDVVSGPLSFFRNADKINNLYKKIDKKLFEDKVHHGVDEEIFANVIKKENIKYDFSCKEHKRPVWWKSDGNLYKGRHKSNSVLFHFGGGKQQKFRHNVINSMNKLHIELSKINSINFSKQLIVRIY